MSRFWAAVRYNLRHNLLPHLLLAAGLCLLTPAVLHIAALDAQAAALPLESMLAFVGVALLTPVFAPERVPGILSAVAARRTPYIGICALRAVMALLFSVACIGAFVLWMWFSESQVTISHALAAVANAWYLGGMGMLAAAISGSTVLGYMVPAAYFVLDFAGGALGAPGLFEATREGTFSSKPYLLLLGLAMAAAALAARWWRLRRR